jgi:hypothetical protein
MSEEQLQQLEDLGAAFTSIEDAAIILQVDPGELGMQIFDKHTPQHQAYHRGRLLSEFETRQSIVSMAKQGSSPAQVMAMKLIKDLKMDDA